MNTSARRSRRLWIGDAYLICDVRTHVLEAALAGFVCESCGVSTHFLPIRVRLRGEVYAIDGARTGLDKCQCALEPYAAVAAGDKGDASRERKLLTEKRGQRSLVYLRISAHGT